MRIPLAYPKIPFGQPKGGCIAFEKYDGTNLHWVWDHDLGWYGMGTRRDRFDLDRPTEFARAHPGLEQAERLFAERLAPGLTAIIASDPGYREAEEIIAFTELLGPGSFAGRHRSSDPKRLVLIDIAIDGVLMDPERFVTGFGHLDSARVVYRGPLTAGFRAEVRAGRFGVAEGVVCKGGRGEGLWMVKIKTDAYRQRLEEAMGADWERYWE